jgi:hypothetical protein
MVLLLLAIFGVGVWWAWWAWPKEPEERLQGSSTHFEEWDPANDTTNKSSSSWWGRADDEDDDEDPVERDFHIFQDPLHAWNFHKHDEHDNRSSHDD